MDDVLEFQQRWAAAELAGDTEALATLLADDFASVGPAGFILDKQGWIGRYASGDLKNEQFRWDNASVRAYGDTVVIIGEQAQVSTYQGNPIPGGSLRFTLVAVRTDGEWRGVSVHLSNIMQPPGR